MILVVVIAGLMTVEEVDDALAGSGDVTVVVEDEVEIKVLLVDGITLLIV